MYYYKIGDKICCSFNGNLSYEKAEMPHPGTPLTFLFEREPGTGDKGSIAVKYDVGVKSF